MFRITVLTAGLVLAFSMAAWAQFDGCRAGFCTGSGPSVPEPSGKILLVDGASFILQTDAASKICRAGGC